MRLPLPRFLMSRLPGGKVSSGMRVQHILTKLRTSLGGSSAPVKGSSVNSDLLGTFGGDESPRSSSQDDSGADLQGLTSASIDSALRDLSAREKVLLLENIQKGLYEAAGQIQVSVYVCMSVCVYECVYVCMCIKSTRPLQSYSL